MRQVATIDDERKARLLADHLLTLDVTTRVDPSKAGWILWVHREEKMDLARREVQAFLANPDDPRYAGAAKLAETTRREKEKADRAHARNTKSLSGRLNVPSASRCPVTYTLIAISIAVSLLTGLGEKVEANLPFVLAPPRLVEVWRMIPLDPDDKDANFVPAVRQKVLQYRLGGLEAARRGQVWRLFSPIFLHFGVMHIAFNMIMLYRLGGLIELRKGSLVMLGLVLFSAAVSNLGNYVWDVQQHGLNGYNWRVGGMSGVLYALFGYCWMKSDYDAEADMKVPSDLIVWMMLWLFICMTGAIGNIANAAHVTGLITGILIGVAPHLIRDRWW